MTDAIPSIAPTVDEETAIIEFDRFIEIWEIDGDTAAMDEESREGFEDHKRKLVRGIMRGAILIDGEGLVTIRLKHTTQLELESITLKIPTGEALLRWDKYKDRQNVHKLNALLGAMCGQPPVIFAKMDARDLKPAMAVATLFLAS